MSFSASLRSGVAAAFDLNDGFEQPAIGSPDAVTQSVSQPVVSCATPKTGPFGY
jgi:hypothetical protein